MAALESVRREAREARERVVSLELSLETVKEAAAAREAALSSQLRRALANSATAAAAAATEASQLRAVVQAAQEAHAITRADAAAQLARLQQQLANSAEALRSALARAQAAEQQQQQEQQEQQKGQQPHQAPQHQQQPPPLSPSSAGMPANGAQEDVAAAQLLQQARARAVTLQAKVLEAQRSAQDSSAQLEQLCNDARLLWQHASSLQTALDAFPAAQKCCTVPRRMTLADLPSLRRRVQGIGDPQAPAGLLLQVGADAAKARSAGVQWSCMMTDCHQRDTLARSRSATQPAWAAPGRACSTAQHRTTDLALLRWQGSAQTHDNNTRSHGYFNSSSTQCCLGRSLDSTRTRPGSAPAARSTYRSKQHDVYSPPGALPASAKRNTVAVDPGGLSRSGMA
jgi:chemotaxis protein histidine kinase CheA